MCCSNWNMDGGGSGSRFHGTLLPPAGGLSPTQSHGEMCAALDSTAAAVAVSHSSIPRHCVQYSRQRPNPPPPPPPPPSLILWVGGRHLSPSQPVFVNFLFIPGALSVLALPMMNPTSQL